MKKIVALLLALVMISSCAVAFASGNVTPEISGEVYFWDTPNPGAATVASQKTDMWLRVIASGQIKCTIPLVLIYTTNIDGGTCDITSGYAIKNYSTAALQINSITSTVIGKDTSGLSIKPKNTVDLSGLLDSYTAYLEVGGTTVDLNTESHNTSALADFLIPKADKSKSETFGTKNIGVHVKFSPLTFITSAATETGDIANKTLGVKMLDVKYVVGISATPTDNAGTIGGTTDAASYTENPPTNISMTYSIGEDGLVTVGPTT